jgi:branched-chain amino acid transport system substrate-binding protein
MRAAALLLGLGLLTGCGTRLDHATVVAGAREDSVTLSPDSIRALTAPRTGGAVAPPAASGQSDGTAPADAGANTTTPVAPSPARLAAGTAGTTTAGAATGRTRGGPSGGPAAPGGSSSPAGSAPDAAPCAASLDPVAVGQIGLFSGVAGPIIGSMRPVLAAWAKELNSHGGLACHPVQIYSEDDGGDPSRSAYLVQNMVSRHHVVAFIAPAVVSPNGFVPAVEAAKVPVVGAPGFDAYRHSAWIFPQSASNDDQIDGFVRNGLERGKRTIGVLYCVEISECTRAAGQVKTAAKANGAEEVYSAPISVTQPDFTAQCLNARNAGVDQLVLGMDGASIARVARSCDSVGYRPLFSTVAGLLSPAQSTDPLVRSFGIATATGEAPYFLQDTPGLRDYHRVLARWAPNTPPDGAGIIAYTSAKLFEKAIANVAADARRGPITPALIVRGLGGIRNESLGGLTVGVTFRPGEKDAASSGCVFYEFLTTTGWTAPNGSRPVCR